MDIPEYAFESGEDPLNRVLTKIKQKNKLLPVEIQQAISSQQPVFIFIPGILGSKLKSVSGEVIWGTWPSQKTGLKYNKTQKVITEPLDDFTALCIKKDVYGEFFKKIEGLNTGSVRHLLYFSYDWRQDNRDSAKEFDHRLNQTEWSNILKGRNVVIVAHSMGGLVSKYWHGKYYSGKEKNYLFKIIGTIHIGVPHKGALSSLATLIEGYASLDASPWFFPAFKDNSIFKALNKFGYTFPSIYQLLPFYDNKLVLFITNTEKEHFIDIYDIENWAKFDWLKNARGENSKKSFYQKIEPLLNAAVEFHSELLNFPPVPNIVYFYSSIHTTIKSITIKEGKNNEYKTEFNPRACGDGRVIKEVAMNKKELAHPNDARPLGEKHGTLPKDRFFIEYIDELRDFAILKSRKKLAMVAMDNPEFLEALISEQVLLEVPMDLQYWGNELFREIMFINNKIISEFSKKIGVTPGELVFRAAENSPDTSIQMNLLALSIAFGEMSGVVEFLAFSKLGKTLYENNYFTSASQFLKKVTESDHNDLKYSDIDSVLFNRTKISAHQKLNDIHKQIGRKTLAKTEYSDNMLSGGTRKESIPIG